MSKALINSSSEYSIPRQARARQSREEIFKTAEAIFAEKGPDGARVDDIAEKSGINKQRIYAYFGSKDELYKQVLLKVYSEAASNNDLLALTEKDIESMTGTIIQSFLKFHTSHPRFWRLLSWENLNGGRTLERSDWKKLRSVYIDHLEQLYKIGQSRSVFRRDVEFSTYLLLVFSFTFFYFSNQVTISNLLNIKLEKAEIQHKIIEQLDIMLKKGIFKR